MQELGETREAMAQAAWNMAENFADNMKHEMRPFWIVFAAKPDTGRERTIRQGIKAYFKRPPALLGILVWYVDNRLGKFEFVPELSSPPDVPVDPSLLSDQASDASPRVMEQGQRMSVLLS